jgi:hypothetical protein
MLPRKAKEFKAVEYPSNLQSQTSFYRTYTLSKSRYLNRAL